MVYFNNVIHSYIIMIRITVQHLQKARVRCHFGNESIPATVWTMVTSGTTFFAAAAVAAVIDTDVYTL